MKLRFSNHTANFLESIGACEARKYIGVDSPEKLITFDVLCRGMPGRWRVVRDQLQLNFNGEEKALACA
jgi:hypothetical protein